MIVQKKVYTFCNFFEPEIVEPVKVSLEPPVEVSLEPTAKPVIPPLPTTG